MAISSKTKIPPFPAERLEAFARVLGDTDHGLTGTEIRHVLGSTSVPDVDPSNTKWKRLYNALATFQTQHQVGNHVVVFITRAMDPAKYTQDRQLFDWRRDRLNPILAFCGYELRQDGKLKSTKLATNLDDALARASRLDAELRRRNVHADVLKFCKAEIIADNYFHAVFEAMKSIASKIRKLSGLTSDGSELIDKAFSLGKEKSPLLAINALNSETLVGEQRGFVSLLKGLYGTIRNPLGHEAKIEWVMSEQDAVDILTTVSLVHRKLDKAHRYKQ